MPQQWDEEIQAWRSLGYRCSSRSCHLQFPHLLLRRAYSAEFWVYQAPTAVSHCAFPNNRLRSQIRFGIDSTSSCGTQGRALPTIVLQHHRESQRPLAARGGTSMGTHRGPAPEETHRLARVPSAERKRAECIGRLVLEPSQELVETCGQVQ